MSSWQGIYNDLHQSEPTLFKLTDTNFQDFDLLSLEAANPSAKMRFITRCTDRGDLDVILQSLVLSFTCLCVIEAHFRIYSHFYLLRVLFHLFELHNQVISYVYLEDTKKHIPTYLLMNVYFFTLFGKNLHKLTFFTKFLIA